MIFQHLKDRLIRTSFSFFFCFHPPTCVANDNIFKQICISHLLNRSRCFETKAKRNESRNESEREKSDHLRRRWFMAKTNKSAEKHQLLCYVTILDDCDRVTSRKKNIIRRFCFSFFFLIKYCHLWKESWRTNRRQRLEFEANVAILLLLLSREIWF